MESDQEESGSLSDDYLNDSFASFGNSTRSLLSPILKEKLYIKTSTPGKDRQYPEASEDYEPAKKEINTPERSKNMVLTRISLANRSEDISVSRSRRSNSSRSGSSYSSSFDSNYSGSYKKSDFENEARLSPYENWLIKKTTEKREKRKIKKIEETKRKMELEEKEKEKEVKKHDIEAKISAWILQKNEKEKIEREEKKRELNKKKQEKMRKKFEIEEKSKKVYREWLEEKQAAHNEAKRKKELEEWHKKQKQVEKQVKSEEAFEKWLQKNRKGQSKNTSYEHQPIGLQGCYDWASYPTPSYINPMPWVHTSSKHKGRASRNKELQPVSPPLLFRDYEQRTKKSTKH